MAQLLDIQKVFVGPDALRALVRVGDGAPLRTSENVEGTARVYWLMPEIADHACMGAEGATFRDSMGDTDLAHLMEHVTLELLARTNIAGDISCGRTRDLAVPRTFEITLDCPDDVLVASALSSAAWILHWAYGNADEASKPNVEAIVAGIMNLTAHAYDMEGNEAPRPGAPNQAPLQVVETRLMTSQERAEDVAFAPKTRSALREEAQIVAEDAELSADEADASKEAMRAEEKDALSGLDLGVDLSVSTVESQNATREERTALRDGELVHRQDRGVASISDVVGFLDEDDASDEDDENDAISTNEDLN